MGTKMDKTCYLAWLNILVASTISTIRSWERQASQAIHQKLVPPELWRSLIRATSKMVGENTWKMDFKSNNTNKCVVQSLLMTGWFGVVMWGLMRLVLASRLQIQKTWARKESACWPVAKKSISLVGTRASYFREKKKWRPKQDTKSKPAAETGNCEDSPVEIFRCGGLPCKMRCMWTNFPTVYSRTVQLQFLTKHVFSLLFPEHGVVVVERKYAASLLATGPSAEENQQFWIINAFDTSKNHQQTG